jgi:hypothetical protein
VASVVQLFVELKQTVTIIQAVATVTPAQRRTAVQQNARQKKVVTFTQPVADASCVKGNEPVISFVIRKLIATKDPSVANVHFALTSCSVLQNAGLKMTATSMVRFALTVIGVEALIGAMPGAVQRKNANLLRSVLLAAFARINFGAQTTAEKIPTAISTMRATNVIIVRGSNNVKTDVKQNMIAKPQTFVPVVVSVKMSHGVQSGAVQMKIAMTVNARNVAGVRIRLVVKMNAGQKLRAIPLSFVLTVTIAKTNSGVLRHAGPRTTVTPSVAFALSVIGAKRRQNVKVDARPGLTASRIRSVQHVTFV